MTSYLLFHNLFNKYINSVDNMIKGKVKIIKLRTIAYVIIDKLIFKVFTIFLLIGMGREVENLILENTQLLETK